MMNDVMIDIETLSNDSQAAIVAIAATLFDPLTGETGEEFYRQIDLRESSDYERGSIDMSTLAWWTKQSSEVIKEAFEISPDSVSLETGLRELGRWICHGPKMKFVRPWGNGSSFDIVILESAFHRHGLPMPWKHWNIRDMRTAVAIGSDILGYDKKKTSFEGVRHNAIADVRHQIKIVCEIYKLMQEKS